MSKHTPGPWKIVPSWHDWIVEGPNGEEIIWQDGNYDTPTISIEDASLIAAAPELLEACQTFAEWLRREEEGFVAAGRSRDTPEGEKEWREWFYGNIALCDLAQDQARAAIAKATGANNEMQLL